MHYHYGQIMILAVFLRLASIPYVVGFK
ncbi:hypothetical protein IFVP5_C270283 [Vibrio parahaemolyticus]